jgi:predicted short-subunit dehydrogenase-like oxidoreductase (DUF2520 family)
MKADQAMGLVIAGSASRSFLARMPALAARLGPIKATSFQAARRVAKALHAGYPTSHYSALEPCPVIWIAVPDASLDRVVRDLAAQMPVRRNAFVVCGSVRESSWPNPLRAAGGRVASLNAVEESREALFVGEGHAEALRAVKRLLGEEQRRLIVLGPGAKPLYFAGVNLAANLMLPWIDGAVEFLRAAGFRRPEATQVAGELVRGALRVYDHAGGRAWNTRAARNLRRALSRFGEVPGEENPKLASLYREGLRLAAGHFGPRSAMAAGPGAS